MNIDILRGDDPDDIEQRRKRLAQIMMLHRARPNLIYRYTYLSRDRLARLRLRSNLPNTPRPHGPSPSSVLLQILRSPDMRDEAAAAAVLWKLHPPTDLDQPRKLARLILGERLCETYLALKAMVPNTQTTLEQLCLLTNVLEVDPNITLTHCHNCRAATLNEAKNPRTQPPTCEACRRRRSSRFLPTY